MQPLPSHCMCCVAISTKSFAPIIWQWHFIRAHTQKETTPKCQTLNHYLNTKHSHLPFCWGDFRGFAKAVHLAEQIFILLMMLVLLKTASRAALCWLRYSADSAQQSAQEWDWEDCGVSFLLSRFNGSEKRVISLSHLKALPHLWLQR